MHDSTVDDVRFYYSLMWLMHLFALESTWVQEADDWGRVSRYLWDWKDCLFHKGLLRNLALLFLAWWVEYSLHFFARRQNLSYLFLITVCLHWKWVASQKRQFSDSKIMTHCFYDTVTQRSNVLQCSSCRNASDNSHVWCRHCVNMDGRLINVFQT